MSCRTNASTHHYACDCREAEFAAMKSELDRVTKERDESFQVIEDLNRHLRNANEIVGTETMGAMGALISERDDALARVEKLEAALKETMNACGCTRVNPPSTTPCDPCEICRRALEGK